MKVYADWYGGVNYSAPTENDREEFPSIRAAGEALWRRSDYDPYYPCVQDSEMLLYRAADEEYPFAILTVGPRGGIRREET